MRTSDLRPALMWDGGPVGVAETTYPHPQGWQLEGAQAGTTMEGMTVRVLTALYRREYECEPSCYTNWPKAVGQVDMQKVIERLASPLITPRDFKSYYRILNRSLYTRNFADCPDTSCRLCARTPERFSHLADCPKIREVFARFRDYLAKSVKGAQLDARLIYLGAYGSKVLTGSMSALHVITLEVCHHRVHAGGHGRGSFQAGESLEGHGAPLLSPAASLCRRQTARKDEARGTG